VNTTTTTARRRREKQKKNTGKPILVFKRVEHCNYPNSRQLGKKHVLKNFLFPPLRQIRQKEEKREKNQKASGTLFQHRVLVCMYTIYTQRERERERETP
jgi:hypothetical protein